MHYKSFERVKSLAAKSLTVFGFKENKSLFDISCKNQFKLTLHFLTAKDMVNLKLVSKRMNRFLN